MTYEQWLEINVPDWRNYRCNGFNDPHEGWHYRYTEYVNTPKPLTPPDALIDETVNFVKETIQGLEDCSITEFEDYYNGNLEQLCTYVHQKMLEQKKFYEGMIGVVVNAECMKEAIDEAGSTKVIIKTHDGHSGYGVYVTSADDPWRGSSFVEIN